jgi:glutathione S-transferase
MSYRLYYSQFCFFCQKVLMPLRGRQHDIELVSVSDMERRRELIAGGGKGQVPCLRIEQPDGSSQWLYESDDILNYLKQQGVLS